MPKFDDGFLDRFWSKVDVRSWDECWNWIVSCQPSGYGQISTTRKDGPALAHRVSYEIYYGPIPEGLCVLHTCDNRRCVNPCHLIAGTREDNMKDMAVKGRAIGKHHKERPWLQGELHGASKLTIEQVKGIRRRAAVGGRGIQTALAKEFPVSRETIGQIVRRETWTWVDDLED